MRLLMRLGLLGALLTASLSACYVHTKEIVVARPAAPAACANAVWVEGHYDRHSRWVPGAWHCQRVVY
jgi:hypothetical protein